MRNQVRIKIGTVTFFIMLSQTQTLEGITSHIPETDKHIVLLEIDDGSYTLAQLKERLRDIQTEYGLSDIFIVSDKEGSYHIWCFTQVSWQTYLMILAQTYDLIDPQFFKYTVKRQKATLRVSRKQGRPPQKIVSVLESCPVPLPQKIEHVINDTGLEKRGQVILLGDGMDKFPEAFDRFEEQVDIRKTRTFEQLLLQFKWWAGRDWKGTSKQMQALKIEADQRGIRPERRRFQEHKWQPYRDYRQYDRSRNYVQRRGRTYIATRDSRGRFTGFRRS